MGLQFLRPQLPTAGLSWHQNSELMPFTLRGNFVYTRFVFLSSRSKMNVLLRLGWKGVWQMVPGYSFLFFFFQGKEVDNKRFRTELQSSPLSSSTFDLTTSCYTILLGRMHGDLSMDPAIKWIKLIFASFDRRWYLAVSESAPLLVLKVLFRIN